MKIGYGEIIKKSFSVAKKAKWLWIYGILLASSGSSFNSSRSISSQDIQNLPSGVSNVFSSLEKIFTTWASQITPSQIVAFFASLTLLAVFSIIIGFVISSWAEGSIIYGAQESLEGKDVNLTNTSPKGLARLKSIIALKLISIAMGIIAMLALIIPTGILAAVSFAVKAPALTVIVGIIAVVVFFVLAVALSGATIYGVRLIVLKNYSAWNAWKDGFKLGRKRPLKLVLSGIISGAIGGLVSFLTVLVSLFVLGLPVFLLVAPLFEGKQAFSFMPVIPSVLLLLVFIWFNSAVTGAVITFKTAFWNQFFEKIWKEK